MRKLGLVGLLLVILPVAFIVGCASYPYPLQEFADADMAIKDAEQVGTPKVNPADVEEAKAEVKTAYAIYRSCRNEEAKKHLAKAIALANKRAAAQGPVAVITGPAEAVVGEEVYYSGEKSYDPDNEPLTYKWSFGDGNMADGSSAFHTWRSSGAFDVKLKVADPSGNSDTAIQKVHVSPRAAEKKFITLSNTVLFDFDKSVIKPDAKVILDDVANTMMQDTAFNALLEGHTDWTGPDAYNMGLSKRRAYAVNDYLVAKGVDGSRFTAKWYGERKPAADNKTKAGRAQNRRTEITLSK